ncbi:MAG: hypothetical protein J7K15_02050 [Deltaproteobacteria bacterium]|nr:hypothetical protein [Deltaproteobacteria bacterium]
MGILTGPNLCDTVLERAHVAILPGSDFYLPANNLGVRIASVDYKGEEILNVWTGPQDMTQGKISELFPRLVGGCDSLEHLLRFYKKSGK